MFGIEYSIYSSWFKYSVQIKFAIDNVSTLAPREIKHDLEIFGIAKIGQSKIMKKNFLTWRVALNESENEYPAIIFLTKSNRQNRIIIAKRGLTNSYSCSDHW